MITRILILLLGVIVNINNAKAFRVFDVNGVETILAMEKENVKIQCKADMPMAYCGFIHPTGKRYSFSAATLDAGQCAIKIQASKADSGEWRCHIGGKGSIGVEVMQYIDLRVVEELAAITKNITTVHGKQVTLACATTKGLTPLRYCRFEPPGGKPFSINSDVTITNSILGRYYFPKNKSLDRGDCAVTIRKVKYEDVGTWACGAGFDDGKEHIDTITLEVEGIYTMSTASATGVAFGAIGIAAFLAVLGFIVWKKRRFLGSVTIAEEQELSHLPTHQTPQASREGTPHVSREGTPHVSREGTPHISKKGTPRVSRERTPQRTIQVTPPASPHLGSFVPKFTVERTPQNVSRVGTQHVSREGTPQQVVAGTPRAYPHLESFVPQITVESPHTEPES